MVEFASQPNPGSSDWYEALPSQLMADEQFKNALDTYRQALETSPERFDIHHDIANLLYARGYCQAAIEQTNLAVDTKYAIAETLGLRVHERRYISREWLGMVGHIGGLDAYFKARILGFFGSRKIKLVLKDKFIANPALFSYFQPFFDEISEDYGPGEEVREYLCNDSLSGFRRLGGAFTHFDAFRTEAIAAWEAQNRPPLVALTDSHREQGRQALKSLGLPEDAWFVCLHVREAGFHTWDDRHFGARNASIDSYRDAVRRITDQGGWVIRMGDATMTPLPPWPNLLDYALSSLKSDWMDVFLSASCRFFLGTASGLCEVPSCFGIPCALTNWPTLGILSPYPGNRFIAKPYLWKASGRPLRLQERLTVPFVSGQDPAFLASLGVEIQDNTAEEITALVQQMLGETSGLATGTETEDAVLQGEFQKLRLAHTCFGGARPGHQFLREALTW